MREFILTTIFFLSIFNLFGQTVYPIESGNYNDVDVPPTKAIGYTLIGLGTGAIAYTAFKIEDTDNPALVYSIGGAFVLTGLAFLIWGDNEGTPNYWKGMKGYCPIKNENQQFIYFDFLAQKRLSKSKQMNYCHR